MWLEGFPEEARKMVQMGKLRPKEAKWIKLRGAAGFDTAFPTLSSVVLWLPFGA